jgi:hypothetical protein
MAKTIPLSNGLETTVDDEDYVWLSVKPWFPRQGPYTFYAFRTEHVFANGRRATISMHSLIMLPPRHLEVDHIDGDGLNNQRSNLRIVTRQQNSCNRRVRRDSSTGVRGVFPQGNGTWKALICIHGKQIYLGTYPTIEAAAAVRAAAETKYFGEYNRKPA